MKKGIFITFEGIDGCGKSTQAARAEALLRDKGFKVMLTREPGGTPIAEKIRSIILDPANDEMTDRAEVLLYLAARAQHVHEKIIPAINSGTVVLCDRFAEATFAYQGYGRGLALNDLQMVNAYATGGLTPDHTFIFDLTVDDASKRLQASGKAPDRLEKAPRGFHEKIRNGYLDMARCSPSRFTVFDATLSIVQLESLVQSHLVQVLKG